MGKITYTGRSVIPMEFVALREAVGWPAINEAQAGYAVRMDLFSIVVLIDEEAVGCARVLGDGVLHFVITDVMVHPRVQRRGVGTKLMELLLEWIGSRAFPPASVELVAAPGTAPFFERLGFTTCSAEMPAMVLSGRTRMNAGNA